MTMRDRFDEVVVDLLDEDPSAVLVLAAIAAGRVLPAARRRGVADRVVDVGIREQTQVGVAGGLALEGFRPILMSYAPFVVERPFEQIKISLSHQGVDAIIVSVGASWDASTAGRTHQAPEDVAVMSTLPGWSIHVPGHEDEAEAALRSAYFDGGSHYIRLANDTNQAPVSGMPGRIRTIRRGPSEAMTVLAIGPMLDDVVAATDELDTTVLYTNVVRPIDGRTLAAATLGTDIVVVEPYLSGTSVPAVASALSDRPMRIHAVGVDDPDVAMYGTAADHRRHHRLDVPGLRERFLAVERRRTALSA